VRAPWGLRISAVPNWGRCFHINSHKRASPRAAQTGPLFRFRFCKRAAHPIFQNSVKGPPLLFDFDVHRTQLRTKRGRTCSGQCAFGEPAPSARFVCNGALRFHPAPGTYVANIHKTLLKRRAFFCFHRKITAGTPNDTASLSWHTGLPNALGPSAPSDRNGAAGCVVISSDASS
jgi:hypothetical protein